MSRLVRAVALLLSLSAARPVPVQTPADLFGPLYAAVEEQHLFADSKRFADAVPRHPAASIMARYRAAPPATSAALRRFVDREFRWPAPPAPVMLPRLSLPAHIAALWPHLTRPPFKASSNGSALSLNYSFVVPGGRFQEIYYWDSYFTMLGLKRDGQGAAVNNMVANFADMIRRYGHVPNGSRTYYLSRSQPPFFYLMTGLTAEQPAQGYARYLPELKAEHAFWMEGASDLRPGEASGHLVRLPDGTLLNRYWDARDTPRDESYAEDVALARISGRPAPELYRDLRSAAESGWDFSSRWLADGRSLGRIETTAIIPVDLNALLYGLERAIAEGSRHQGDQATAARFEALADARRAAISRFLWNAEAGAFEDWNWRERRLTGRLTAATVMPLFTGVASREQAGAVARTVEADLLRPGGLATTSINTGQQWDEPNGWAPLQWIAVEGFSRYGENGLADSISRRWLGTVSRVYACTGRLVEKYDVDHARTGGGGEYPVQDGFGWTNGVTRVLLDRTPIPDTTCVR
jgi:alpha,alpha-trehalase